ncbi:MAG: hypothetical protein SFU27_03085 [Thermonemataceae bacterium]|nr:hypothetical protein [Thermonemataceae bacterium]
MKWQLFAVFLFFSNVSEAQVSVRKYVMQILRIYSPQHAQMLQKYYKTNSIVKLPSASINIGRHLDFMVYFTDTTHRDVTIHDIPLMIHDMYHDYTRRQAYNFLEKNPERFEVGKEYIMYYFDADKEIFTEIYSSFPANEIASVVPSSLKQERYKTFVLSNKPDVLPQKWGLYGLLDEWNAFYHQTRSAFEIKRFYERETYQNAKHWEGFFANYYDSYHAHLEFKYFTLKYLQYAKYKHTQFFEKIMQNQEIKQVYQEIDGHYETLLNDFNTYKPLVVKFLADKEILVSEEVINGSKVMFLQGVGIETNNHLFELYQKALEDEELRMIDFQLRN